MNRRELAERVREAYDAPPLLPSQAAEVVASAGAALVDVVAPPRPTPYERGLANRAKRLMARDAHRAALVDVLTFRALTTNQPAPLVRDGHAGPPTGPPWTEPPPK